MSISKANNFGKLLVMHRRSKQLTIRQLAGLTGLGYRNISMWENNYANKTCGTATAAKLAVALGLTGHQRYEFLCAAAATMKTAPVIADAAGYPAELLDAVALKLRNAGIRPSLISGVEINWLSPSQLVTRDIVVRCGNAECYAIDIHVTRMRKRSGRHKIKSR